MTLFGNHIALSPAATQYLHELVDTLSSTLDVPIELTSPQLVPLAKRTDSTFGDARTAPVIGLADVIRPTGMVVPNADLTVPAVAELGIGMTHVLPVRVRTRTVALLWLIDEKERLSGGHLAYARAATESTIRALTAAADARPLPRRSSGELLAAAGTEAVAAMLRTAIDASAFSHSGEFFAVSVLLRARNSHAQTLFDIERILGTLSDRASALLAGHRVLGSVQGAELALLCAPFPRDDTSAMRERLATVARDHLYRFDNSRLYSSWSLGFSARVRTLEQAGEAFRQARTASRLGQRLDRPGAVLDWSTIKHLRGISSLEDAELMENFVDPALAAFLADESVADLAATLRSFLSNAGHIPEVASEMFLHRASVYHRLHKIEELLDVDLSDGIDRLQLHLGIVTWDFLHGAYADVSEHTRDTRRLPR